MSLQWSRGAQVSLDGATFRGGPFPDDIEAWITRLYGPHPAYDSGFHYGLDSVPWARVRGELRLEWPYPAGEGCPLLSLGHGEVYWRTDNHDSFGNAVGIRYDDGEGGHYKVQYFHMDAPAIVAIGDYVRPGQEVGYVGTTGFSTGPHLHLAVYHNDYIQDPLPFLDQLPALGYFPPEPYVVPIEVAPLRLPLPMRIVYVGYDIDRWMHVAEVRVGGRRQRGAFQQTLPPYGDGDEEVWPFEVQDWG